MPNKKIVDFKDLENYVKWLEQDLNELVHAFSKKDIPPELLKEKSKNLSSDLLLTRSVLDALESDFGKISSDQYDIYGQMITSMQEFINSLDDVIDTINDYADGASKSNALPKYTLSLIHI